MVSNTSPKTSEKVEKVKSKIRYLNYKMPLEISSKKPGRPRKIKPLEKGPYKCEQCNEEFDKWALYQQHQQSHTTEKKYKCNSCDASYNILVNI